MRQLLNRIDLRQLYLIAGSVALLSVTALVMLMGKPVYETYARTAESLHSLRGIAASGSYNQAIAGLETEIAGYEKTLRGELQNIPLRQLESHIIGALQNSAWRSDVELLSVEPLEALEGLPYREIAFRLEVEGEYFNLDRWMSDLGEQLGYVVFKEYTLKVAKTGAEPRISARVLLAAYRVGDLDVPG